MSHNIIHEIHERPRKIKSLLLISSALFIGLNGTISTASEIVTDSTFIPTDEAVSNPVNPQENQPYWNQRYFSFTHAQLNTTFTDSVADKVSDPKKQGISFLITPENSWLHMDSAGNLYGIPDKAGVYTYQVTVTDGNQSLQHPDIATMTVIVSGDDVPETNQTTDDHPDITMIMGTSDTGVTQTSCLNGITNYSSTGPFSYTFRIFGHVKMWVPSVPAGCKIPVIHLANGTGARCSTYIGILRHLASHGFLATCYESTNTGEGTQCITAVETALSNYPEMTSNKLGFTGHSQGGGAAFICTYRAEQQWGNQMQVTGHAIEPASGFGVAPLNWSSLYAAIQSPMFMFNGSLDTLVSSLYVSQAFRALNSSVEAVWYQANGAVHIPIPTSWSEESATAWFRWKLLGDQAACQYLKNMPQQLNWSYMSSQNDAACH